MAPTDDYQVESIAAFDGMDELCRPWQLEMAGDLVGSLTGRDSDAILTHLFEYRPDVSAVTIQAEGGAIQVRRVFPSHKTDVVDAMLVAFFKAVPNAIGLVLHSEDGTHVATPEAPYASPLGEGSAAIRVAREQSEISNDEARQRFIVLAKSTRS